MPTAQVLQALRRAPGAGWVAPDGKVWVTAEQAGALCVTADSPKGVKASTYRKYAEKNGAPDSGLRHPTTGVQLYSAARVLAWHAARPGRGRWGPRASRATP